MKEAIKLLTEKVRELERVKKFAEAAIDHFKDEIDTDQASEELYRLNTEIEELQKAVMILLESYIFSKDDTVPYTEEQYYTISQNMIRFGGSFSHTMGHLLQRADMSNKNRLAKAYPEDFKEFLTMKPHE